MTDAEYVKFLEQCKGCQLAKGGKCKGAVVVSRNGKCQSRMEKK